MTNFWEHAERLADILVVVGPAVWWLRGWLRRIVNSTTFTGDVAKIHLPHIYYRLRRVDDKLGLQVIEHPSIVYRNGSANGVNSAATSGSGSTDNLN